MGVRHFFSVAFWFILYLSLILTPLFVLLIGPTPPGRGFWHEFAVALGYSGLAMMGVQFALTARFRRATAPYGIDIIYYFHRQVSMVGFAFIIAHVLILYYRMPSYVLALLKPFSAPWQGRAALAGTVSLCALMATSLWRKKLRIRYERWRLWHGMLAVAVVALPLVHAHGVGYYFSALWKRAFWVLYTAFWGGLLVYVRLVKPWVMIRHPYTVEEIVPEGAKAWTLVLRPEGHEGIRFKAGQFAWLTIWKSPFAIEEHPFSFSSSAMSPERLCFTIKERGDFTSTIKDVKVGQRVYLDGPYGSFTIDHEASRGYVFIAGGIGIAPVMSMLRTLSDRGEQRPILLIYGNERWEKVTFREEINSLEKRLNLLVVHLLERPPEGWEGEKGYATAELLGRYLPEEKNGYEYFVCGPDPMMDMVERALYGYGISIAKFHSERFDIV